MRMRFAAICTGIMLLAVVAPASAHVQEECQVVVLALAIAMQASNSKWVETGEWAQAQSGTMQNNMSRDEVLDLFVAVMQRVDDGLKLTAEVNKGIGKFAECLGGK